MNIDTAAEAMNEFNNLIAKDSIGTGYCCNCDFNGLMFERIAKGMLCLECTTKIEDEVKFKEDGTAFVCLVDGDIAEFIVEKSGTQPGTPYGPEEHWAEGILKCPTCGAEQDYSVST